MKKTSFSHFEFLQQEVPEGEIQFKDGGKYIPIGLLEAALDHFVWSTQNFTWNLYKDGNGKNCVAASIELLISFDDEDGYNFDRTFVGACNFPLFTLPFQDFLATAKSQCIKNAASDAGRRLGRGLNDEVIPQRNQEPEEQKPKEKMLPDSGIKKQFAAAKARGDVKAMTVISNIYELNPEDNGDSH